MRFNNAGGAKHKNETTFTAGDPRAAELGAIKSEAKAAAVRENGKAGGRPKLAPADRPCTCGIEGNVAPENHKSACAQRQAWRRQQNKEPA